MNKRMVISGMGAVTPYGVGVSTLFDNLLKGNSAISKTPSDIIDPPVSYSGFILKDVFDIKDYLPKDWIRKTDPFTQLGLVSVKEALKDADVLDNQIINKDRVAVVLSSSFNGLNSYDQAIDTLHTRGLNRVDPFVVPKIMPNAISGMTSIAFGFTGPSLYVCSTCSSSITALIIGVQKILLDEADMAIVGGSDVLSMNVLRGFTRLKALSTHFSENPEKASRPFDRDRDGVIISEGSASLVIEEYEHALKRGAPIYAEICGYAETQDAYHLVAPHPEGKGSIKAMEDAISMAGIHKEDIDLLNAHATSTPVGDRVENQAIKDVFKDHAKNLKIQATKSMLGHLLSGSAAIGTIACALEMKNKVIHPTINLEHPDEGCDLDYVANEKINYEANYSLVNSLGFGGHNAALVLKKAR